MVYRFNKPMFWRMSLHSMFNSVAGRVGIVISVVMILTAIVLLRVYNARFLERAENILRARDEASVRVLGYVAFIVVLLIAFFVLVGAWASSNKDMGSRLDQELQINDDWLLYSYRPVGFYDPRSRVVVLASTDGLESTYDQNSETITLYGSIWTVFCQNVELQWPCPRETMERVEKYQIANCFIPDLEHDLRKL